MNGTEAIIVCLVAFVMLITIAGSLIMRSKEEWLIDQWRQLDNAKIRGDWEEVARIEAAIEASPE